MTCMEQSTSHCNNLNLNISHRCIYMITEAKGTYIQESMDGWVESVSYI